MGLLKERLAAGLTRIITQAGTPLRVQYFTLTIGSVYDDDVGLAKSGGDLWTSGIVFPLSNQPGHSDSILLEQGKLINSDSRLFIHGSLLLTGSEHMIKITVGSPSSKDTNYSIVTPGPIKYEVANTPIYKVVYIRRVGGTGSLFGE